MSTTHTPGAWKFSALGWEVTDEHGIRVARVEFILIDNELAVKEMSANGSLLASAPELLAACEEALNMLGAARDHCTGERGLIRRIDEAANAAYAAIAKAKGGAQ